MSIFVLLFILFATFTTAAENSIVPLMESFEIAENLPKQKFTNNQFKEISATLEKKDEKIRLVTYNMLFDLYDYNMVEANRWPRRLPRIIDLIHTMNPDIIATQELYPKQAREISDALSNEFSFFPGQKDSDGESYGIFYRKERFILISGEVLYPLTHLELKDLKTEKIVHIFNTHMPYADINKREDHTQKIVKIIEPYAQKNGVIFTGDLNTFPSRLDLTGLPFYDGDYITRILTGGSLKNSETVSLIGHFGPISTFTSNGIDGRAFQGTGTPGVILDHIYVSPQITVLTHATEPGTVDGHYPSDHMPVIIDFINK